MIAKVRPATPEDLNEIMPIYGLAREFMRRNGNNGQWVNGYPNEQFILQEIEEGHSFVCENHEGEITGTFCFIIGEDPTYLKIYEGHWLNNDLYGTVHRLGSSGKDRGVAKACFEWCFNQCPNIRVDTHRDNKVMQQIIRDLDFQYCGIIYLSDGSERLAYQRTLKNEL